MLNHTRLTRIALVGDCGDGAVINTLSCFKAFHYYLCHAGHISDMLKLASENEFDVIFVDLDQSRNRDLITLERICEAFSRTPIVVLLENDAEAVRQQALSLGVHEALVKSTLSGTSLVDVIRRAIQQKSDELRNQQEHHLEQALRFLQHHSVISHTVLTPEAFGVKPLCQAIPYKFLELAKTYSNLIELVSSRPAREGMRFSGHSVSRKLQFLASDLGGLKAGVGDVIDLHAKAVESKFDSVTEPKEESRKLLLELMTDLVSYYRKSEVR